MPGRLPNTLTDTGFGYSGVTLNAHASAAEIEPFLRGFGKVLYLPERLIDVFTGFGVAGPNYIYYFIETLTDAGVLAGLSRPQATEVVLENLLGAVKMLRQSQKHPRQLLDINNSPAGVGIHALYELNNSDFAAGFSAAYWRRSGVPVNWDSAKPLLPATGRAAPGAFPAMRLKRCGLRCISTVAQPGR